MTFVPSYWNYFGNGWSGGDSLADSCPYYYPMLDCRISNYKYPFTEEAFTSKSRCFTGTAVLNSKQNLAESGKNYYRCLEMDCVSEGGK